MNNSWYVYLLQNSYNKKTYLGITNDLDKRIKAHNTGNGAKYTRAFKGEGIWRIVCYLDNLTKSNASSIEARVKSNKLKNNKLKGETNVDRRMRLMEEISGNKVKEYN